MSCMACLEPALPRRACFHAWGWACLSRLCVMSGVPHPVDVWGCWTHARRKELFWLQRWFYAVVAVRFVRKGVAVSFLSVSVHCNTRTVRPNWFYPGNFKPYLPAFTGRPLLWEVLSSPLQIPCPTEESPRFLFWKTFKSDSVAQGASCGQNPFDTRSILTEKEKNHLPRAIWRIQMLQFSFVMNFTLGVQILKHLSSQRLKLP